MHWYFLMNLHQWVEKRKSLQPQNRVDLILEKTATILVRLSIFESEVRQLRREKGLGKQKFWEERCVSADAEAKCAKT